VQRILRPRRPAHPRLRGQGSSTPARSASRGAKLPASTRTFDVVRDDGLGKPEQSGGHRRRPRLLRTRHHQARPRQRPTGPRYTIRSPSQNWIFGGRCTAHQTRLPCAPSRQAHPADGYQRSVMCLTAWLITNAGAGRCIRMRRGNSLISATWPRFATPVRGSPAGPVQASTLWWYAICSGVTHAGMRAEARPRHAWAGWTRWGFLGFPGPATRISCQTPRSGSGPHVWAVPLRRTVPKGRAK